MKLLPPDGACSIDFLSYFGFSRLELGGWFNIESEEDDFYCHKNTLVALERLCGGGLEELLIKAFPERADGRRSALDIEYYTRYLFDPYKEVVSYEVSSSVALDETSDFEAIRANTQDIAIFCDKKGNTTALYLKRLNVLVIKKPLQRLTIMAETEMVKKRLKKIVSLISPVEQGVKKKVSIPKVNIGMDIEFSIIDSDGQFHPATEFVADTEEAPIGTDGNVETLEIRPEYAKDPLTLVDNLDELLGNINQIIPQGYDIWGGGGEKFRRSTGTHIHFSGISTDNDNRGGAKTKELVRWLDCLIGGPVRTLPGIKRADANYGQPGDFRCNANHGGFHHHGFEWRSLPTFTPTRESTKGLVCLCYMVACAYEMGMTIEFNEKAFGIEWYKDLPLFSKYEGYVKKFVEFIEDGGTLSRPTLESWYKKEFAKDKECDVEIVFANDADGFLAISPYMGYNPQKIFDRVVFYVTSDPAAYSVSESVASLMRYFMSNRGENIRVRESSDALKVKYAKKGERTLFFGIPRKNAAAMASRSRGSRNGIKMFSQEIIKNI
jgi:hypothetical protein